MSYLPVQKNKRGRSKTAYQEHPRLTMSIPIEKPPRGEAQGAGQGPEGRSWNTIAERKEVLERTGEGESGEKEEDVDISGSDGEDTDQTWKQNSTGGEDSETESGGGSGAGEDGARSGEADVDIPPTNQPEKSERAGVRKGAAWYDFLEGDNPKQRKEKSRHRKDPRISQWGEHRCTHPGCGYKKTGYPSALMKHVRNKHERGSYPCTECGKVCSSAMYMQTHRRKVHGSQDREKSYEEWRKSVKVWWNSNKSKKRTTPKSLPGEPREGEEKKQRSCAACAGRT